MLTKSRYAHVSIRLAGLRDDGTPSFWEAGAWVQVAICLNGEKLHPVRVYCYHPAVHPL